jgi:hypothetical protein
MRSKIEKSKSSLKISYSIDLSDGEWEIIGPCTAAEEEN